MQLVRADVSQRIAAISSYPVAEFIPSNSTTMKYRIGHE